METVESSENSVENQIVTFNIEEEDYGININHIKEIIEIPRITHVPNTPDYFEGIINLRGEILSVVNMRKRFNLDDKERDEFARIIVSKIRGYRIGIVVDSVSEVVKLRNLNIQPPPPITSDVKKKIIEGMIELNDKKRIILLLNVNELINDSDFKESEKLTVQENNTTHFEEQKKVVEEVQMVTFRLASENYGIEIHEVEEILNIPVVTPVPQAPDFIEGVISLRDKIIPLVNLRFRFDLGAVEDIKQCSVIIITVSEVRIGLIVDEISEVLRILKENIAPAPPNLSSEEAEQVQGVVKHTGSDGKIRLILLLRLENIFSRETQEILNEMAKNTGETTEDDKKADEENLTIVTFQTGEDIFGVHIESVKEISTVPEITGVPKAPPFVEGVINLRGEVITVIDLRKRFGFDNAAKGEFTRIVIVDIDGITTGLQVDFVKAVHTITGSSIEDTPKIIEGVNTEFLEGVVRLSDEKKMLLMLNLQKILTEKEKVEVLETTADRKLNSEDRRGNSQDVEVERRDPVEEQQKYDDGEETIVEEE